MSARLPGQGERARNSGGAGFGEPYPACLHLYLTGKAVTDFAFEAGEKMRILGLLGIALILANPTSVLLAQGQSSGEISVPEGTGIKLQLNNDLSTRLNSEGDSFTANVIAPLYFDNRLVIPKGSIVTGSVSRVVRPGRLKGKAVMNLVFSSIHIPGRGEMAIVASLSRVDPEGNAGVGSEGTIRGEGSTGADAARILKPGLVGAGIGGLAGGGRGAVVGSGVGAAIGLATIFSTRGKDLEMRRGSTLDILLDRPLLLPPDTEVRGARIR
jgi:hypothetical protein